MLNDAYGPPVFTMENVASLLGLMIVQSDLFRVGELKSSEVMATAVRAEKVHKNINNMIECQIIFFITTPIFILSKVIKLILNIHYFNINAYKYIGVKI